MRKMPVKVVGSVLGLIVGGGLRRGKLHWPFVAEAMAQLPFTIGWQLRREVFERVLSAYGEGSIVHQGATITDVKSEIGNDVWISRNCYVEYALIHDHVLIGPHAVLLAGRRHHRTESATVPIKLQGNLPLDPISIGEGAWIGANAVVMADVGRHAIVGAGAVVIEPVPDGAVVVGNPARIVRIRR